MGTSLKFFLWKVPFWNQVYSPTGVENKTERWRETWSLSSTLHTHTYIHTHTITHIHTNPCTYTQTHTQYTHTCPDLKNILRNIFGENSSKLILNEVKYILYTAVEMKKKMSFWNWYNLIHCKRVLKIHQIRLGSQEIQCWCPKG